MEMEASQKLWNCQKEKEKEGNVREREREWEREKKERNSMLTSVGVEPVNLCCQ